MATDSDPYFALPKLYGAPAYARPPRVVPASERPFDPDDLPIAAEMTEEERAVTSTLRAPGSYWAAPPMGVLPDHASASASSGNNGRSSAGGGNGSGHNGNGGGNGHRGGNGNGGTSAADRRFSLRALTERLGPRPK